MPDFRGFKSHTIGLLVSVTCFSAPSATAQPTTGNPPTNAAVYQQLASICLAGVADTLGTFRVSPDPRLAFLLSGTLDRWTSEGRTVFLADSASSRLPLLQYRTGDAEVSYDRIGRQSVRRSVRLALEIRLSDPDGRLLVDDFCDRSYVDTLLTANLAAIEHTGYPDTQAPHPHDGVLRRYVEPAVLTAAVGAVIYLFFTVRSGTSK